VCSYHLTDSYGTKSGMVTHVESDLFLGVQPGHAPSQGGWAQHSQFLGPYAHTSCRRMVKFSVIIHLGGSSMFLND